MKYEELSTLKKFKCRDKRTGAYYRAVKKTNGDSHKMEEGAFFRIYRVKIRRRNGNGTRKRAPLLG